MLPGNEYNGLANKNRIHDKLHPNLARRVMQNRGNGAVGKNVELILDGKHEHRNANHNCGAIDRPVHPRVRERNEAKNPSTKKPGRRRH